MGAEYCRDCRQVKRRTGEKPPCPDCSNRQPELYPDNRPAWALFQRVRTQWRTGPMGAITGLDYQAVYLVAGSIGAPMHRGNLERIQVLEDLELRSLAGNGKE